MKNKRKPKSIRRWIRKEKRRVYDKEVGNNPSFILKWKKNSLYRVNDQGEKEKIYEIIIG